jgi:hypothetical protein
LPAYVGRGFKNCRFMINGASRRNINFASDGNTVLGLRVSCCDDDVAMCGILGQAYIGSKGGSLLSGGVEERRSHVRAENIDTI